MQLCVTSFVSEDTIRVTNQSPKGAEQIISMTEVVQVVKLESEQTLLFKANAPHQDQLHNLQSTVQARYNCGPVVQEAGTIQYNTFSFLLWSLFQHVMGFLFAI